MLQRLSRTWKKLKQGTPGHRFRDRYQRNHRAGKPGHWLGRILRLIAAGVALVIGVVLVFIPGPAIVFFLLAGAMLASDWLWMARALDWSEVRLRSLWKRVRRLWHRMSAPSRLALLAAGACCSLAFTYGFYRLLN